MLIKLPKIRWKDIVTLFIIFVFFPPLILERLSSSADRLQSLVQLACLGLLFIMIIMKKRLRIMPTLIGWALFCAHGLIVTCFKLPNMIYTYTVKVVVPILYVSLICMYYRTEKGGMDRLLRCMTLYWEVLILANLLMMLAFPGGIIRSAAGSTHDRANWLIGSKNNIVFPLVFAGVLILRAMQRDSMRRRLVHIAVLFVAGFEILASGSERVALGAGSSTGLVAYLCLFVLCVMQGFAHRTKLDLRLSILLIALIFLVVDAVLIHGATNSQSLFGRVSAMFGKDPTGRGRTEVWLEVLPLIYRAPILGNGYLSTVFNVTLTSSYNYYLDCGYRYGLLGIGLLFIVFYAYNREGPMELYEDEKVRLESYVFQCGFACLMICGLVNTIKWQWLALMLELYAYADGRDYNRLANPLGSLIGML